MKLPFIYQIDLSKLGQAVPPKMHFHHMLQKTNVNKFRRTIKQ